MCLAVPAKIKSLDGFTATVDMMGIEKTASTRLVPDAKPGDYVLVHAGFGIQVIDPEEARRTLEDLDSLGAAAGEDAAADPLAAIAAGALC